MNKYKIVRQFPIRVDKVIGHPPGHPPGVVVVIDYAPKEDVKFFIGKKFVVEFSDGTEKSYVVDIAKNHVTTLSLFVKNVTISEFENASCVIF